MFPFSRFYEEIAEKVVAGRPAEPDRRATAGDARRAALSAIVEVPTVPVRVAVPVAEGVVPAPVVLVGSWDDAAVVRVAQARPTRPPPVPIAPYEELIVDPDPRLLEDTVPSPLLAVAPPEPAAPAATPPAPPADLTQIPTVELPARAAPPVSARDAWDADQDVDEVIQEWFDRPMPAPPPETSGEIPLY